MELVTMNYKKVILLTGDPDLVLPVLLQLKQACFPTGANSTEWVELYASRKKDEGYTLKQVIEELSSLTWENTRKVVILRGIMDIKEFKEGILKIIPQITEPHILIIWDSANLIANSKRKDSLSALKTLCKAEG